MGRPIVLVRWQRLACAAFGFSVTGTGAYATLYLGNQGGSVALIVLGGIGLLVALTGRVPDRIGRDGVIYDPVGEQAKQELADVIIDESIPAETRARVAERVLEHQDLSPQNVYRLDPLAVLQRSIHSAIFEAAVLEQLRRLKLPDHAQLVTEYSIPSEGERHIVDAVLRRPDETDRKKMVAIEISFAITRNEALERINRLRNDGFQLFALIVPRRRSPVTVNNNKVRIVEFGEIGQGSSDLTESEISALEVAIDELWAQRRGDS